MAEIVAIIVAGVLYLTVLVLLFLNQRAPKGKTELVVTHEYHASTDYRRRFQLLSEGRKVIVIGPHGWPTLIQKVKYPDDDERVTGFGFGFTNRNPKEEEFVTFCTLNKVAFLDQIDKYEKYL